MLTKKCFICLSYSPGGCDPAEAGETPWNESSPLRNILHGRALLTFLEGKASSLPLNMAFLSLKGNNNTENNQNHTNNQINKQKPTQPWPRECDVWSCWWSAYLEGFSVEETLISVPWHQQPREQSAAPCTCIWKEAMLCLWNETVLGCWTDTWNALRKDS